MGLNPNKHLGKELSQLESYLHKLKEYVLPVSMFKSSLAFSDIEFILFTFWHRLYGINVCGEGGEYETLTLDCPLFKVSSGSSFSLSVILQVFLWLLVPPRQQSSSERWCM